MKNLAGPTGCGIIDIQFGKSDRAAINCEELEERRLKKSLVEPDGKIR